MDPKPFVRHVRDVEAKEVEHSRLTTIQVLIGPEDEVPYLYTRLFTVEPGGLIPHHFHDKIDHEQLVLDGELTLILDGREQTVRANDAVYIPKKVSHSYENRSKNRARFLCMVPATSDYSTKWL